VHGDATGPQDSLTALVNRLAEQVAAAMCSQPEFNLGRICYDTPARPREAVAVPDVPRPGEAPPTAAEFLVRVLKSGEVADVRVKSPSNHDDVTALALAAVRQAAYLPATKAGQPVEAWAAVPVAVRTGAAGKVAAATVAQCSVRGYNPNKVCWDTRAQPLSTPAVPWRAPGALPTPATFWVRVSATGEVESVTPLAASSTEEFGTAAMSLVRDMRFNPAQKGGRPVASWTQIAVSAERPAALGGQRRALFQNARLRAAQRRGTNP
jgi:TonB family protein